MRVVATLIIAVAGVILSIAVTAETTSAIQPAPNAAGQSGMAQTGSEPEPAELRDPMISPTSYDSVADLGVQVALQNGPRLLATDSFTATGTYSVTTLGTLDSSGANNAYDINRHGQVVGRVMSENQELRAFIWTDANNNLISDDGEMEPVGVDGGVRSEATGISESGYIAGTKYYNLCFCGPEEERGESWLPFVRKPTGDVSELNGFGYIASASAVNNAGTVVGVAVKDSEFGFVYLPAAWKDGSLSHPWDFRGEVNDLNDAGDMVGEQFAAWDRDVDDTEEAVAVIDDSFIRLNEQIGGFGSSAAMNNLGHVVGWVEQIPGRPANRHAFLWRDTDEDEQADPEEFVDLGALDGSTSTATDVNDDGLVIGHVQYTTGESRPFLWKDWNENGQSDAGEMVDLNDLIEEGSGWVLEQATAINEKGQIVGIGTFNGLAYQAFLLTPPLKPWTVLFYLDGDNNLDHTYPDIMNQLESAADNPYVNVVVLWDRLGEASRMYHIQHDTDMDALATYAEGDTVWSLAEQDMSDPNTLSDFVTLGMNNFPARNFALVLDDHGSGLGGGLTDDSVGGAHMSLKEMQEALDDVHVATGRRLDVLYMAMCLMGMLEDAYQFRDVTDYYVASENLQWALDEPYDGYISGIGAATTPEGVALVFAASYANAAAAKSLPHTISVVDTNRINLVATGANALGQAMALEMDETSAQFIVASLAAQRFDNRLPRGIITPDDTSVDLYDFAKHVREVTPDIPLIQSAATIVMAGVEAAVVYERHGSSAGTDLSDSKGIAVFLPNNPSSFYNEENYDFAVGGWTGVTSEGLQQDDDTWASMLVALVEATNPDGVDEPLPPPPVPKLLEEADDDGPSVLLLPLVTAR